MIEIQLLRQPSGEDHTHGDLYINGDWVCYTLEDEHRYIKVAGETRIPEGLYVLKLRTEGGFHPRYAERYGDMHKGMIWLQDVPDFKYVYIHTGNTDEHTSGCILVGLTRGNETIGRSRDAYRNIYPMITQEILTKEEVTMEIRDA